MTLRYPTARLMIYNRLVGCKESCASSLVNCAREFGLMEHYNPAHTIEGDETGCGAMNAARAILQGNFQTQKKDVSTGHSFDSVWRSFEDELAACKDRFKLNYTTISPPEVAECSKLAPMVFDLLLQHLRRQA